MPKKYEIYSVKDHNSKKIIKKEKIFDLTHRLLLCGKTQAGKGVVATNFLLLPQYYFNDFKPENIYIFSKSLMFDKKTKIMIKQKRIPNSNLFNDIDDETLNVILDFIEGEYLEAEERGEKPEHSLIIIDDLMENLKERSKDSAINNLFVAGRHKLISCWVMLQFYNKLPNVARQNANALVCFELPKKQMEEIEKEHNYLDTKKEFMEKYKKATKEDRGFFVINHTNDRENRYLDKHFNNIELPEDN